MFCSSTTLYNLQPATYDTAYSQAGQDNCSSQRSFFATFLLLCSPVSSSFSCSLTSRVDVAVADEDVDLVAAAAADDYDLHQNCQSPLDLLFLPITFLLLLLFQQGGSFCFLFSKGSFPFCFSSSISFLLLLCHLLLLLLLFQSFLPLLSPFAPSPFPSPFSFALSFSASSFACCQGGRCCLQSLKHNVPEATPHNLPCYFALTERCPNKCMVHPAQHRPEQPGLQTTSKNHHAMNLAWGWSTQRHPKEMS